MTWIIVGASSGVGRAIAERMARDHKSMILVSSDLRDLCPLASDINIHYGVKVKVVSADASFPEQFADKVAEGAVGEHVDGIIFSIGTVCKDDTGELYGKSVLDLMNINLTSIILVCAHFLPLMSAQRHGTLVAIGSIAAIRGRGRNIVYSGAKSGLKTYFDGLCHRYWKYGITIQTYILGYHETNLAYGQRLLLKPAKPEITADSIVKRLNYGSGIFYLPRFWSFIASVLRCMPWLVFKRIDV